MNRSAVSVAHPLAAVGPALCALLLLAGGPSPARAAEKAPSPRVRIAAFQHKGLPDRLRWALVAWAQEVRLRTSIEIAQEPAMVGFQARELFAHPLLYLGGDTMQERFSDGFVAALARHLSTGGTLIIDNTGRSGPSESFEAPIRKLVQRAFGRGMERIPPSHVLSRRFYRLSGPVGRRASARYLEGLRLGRRYAVIYIPNDLQGAFARAPAGGPALRVVPGGEAQREMAYRLGVNLLMYVLCLDYKDDHAHVSQLLKRRRGLPPRGP